MSFMRVLKWIVITLALVVMAVVLYLNFADLNWLKPRIEAAVAEATGRELKINGELGFRILPTTSIVLEDVSFANAAWGSQPSMATIGHFSGKLSPWSLVSGPVRIRNIRLQDVNLVLETNEQEEGNWALTDDTAKEPAPAGEPNSEF